MDRYKDMLGCLGVVIDPATGMEVFGIITEVGPTDNDIGEVSIYAVDQIMKGRDNEKLENGVLLNDTEAKPPEGGWGSASYPPDLQVEVIAFPDSVLDCSALMENLYEPQKKSNYGIQYTGNYSKDYGMLLEAVKASGEPMNEGVPYHILAEEFGFTDETWKTINDAIQEEGRKYYPNPTGGNNGNEETI